MTAKEKAEDIVDKYIQLLPYHSKESNRKRAIGSALLAVDEILEDDMYDMGEEFFNKRIEFWEEVKEEINKL